MSNHCLPSLFLGGKEQLVIGLNSLFSRSKYKSQGSQPQGVKSELGGLFGVAFVPSYFHPFVLDAGRRQ